MMIPRLIMIHHSLTKDSGTVSWGAIRRYHVEEKGWSDIGYHFGIELICDVLEVLVGRMPDVVGAHCLGMNSQSIGICVVGNYDVDPVGVDLVHKLYQLVSWLQKVYAIPDSKIVGHNEFSEKTCPGKNLWPVLSGMKAGMQHI